MSLDPVYTVPDPHGHDIKLNSFKTSVALKSMIILQNLITTNHRKSGKSKDDLKLTELDVVTMRIRYRVTGSYRVSFWGGKGGGGGGGIRVEGHYQGRGYCPAGHMGWGSICCDTGIS